MVELIEALRRRIAQLDGARQPDEPGSRAYMPMDPPIGIVWLPDGIAPAQAEAEHLRLMLADLLTF